MRKVIASLLCLSLLVGFTLSANAQKKMSDKKSEQKSTKLKQMTWTTKSDAARELAFKGARHHRNVEYELAYEDFLSALKLDPNFTIPLVFMATLTKGDTHKAYAKRAIESAANKTEGEKLFASIVDEKSTPESNREVWAKLHEMFPDGAMIGHYYVVTRATPDEQFEAALQYINKFPDEPAMYNMLAYYYMNNKKDFDLAKQNFEKYIALYPDGYNPYDSMGEFYATTGDVPNAEKYYAMSLEKYPFNSNSIAALKKIDDNKKANAAKKE